MSDMISQGRDDDGPRRPRPRWMWPAAALAALVVVAVLVVTHRPGAAHHAAAAPSPEIRVSAGIIRESAPSGPGQPVGVAGPTLPWTGGLRLLVDGPQPSWLSPRTGRLIPVSGLPRNVPSYTFVRASGGWAVLAQAPMFCGSCSVPGEPAYFLADGAARATPAGAASAVAPAATSGALWLTSYPPGVDPATATGLARPVSATGRALGPQVRLPAGYEIRQATHGGLLLVPLGGWPRADLLWNPRTRRVSRRITHLIAAAPDAVAWTGPCAGRCRVRVLALATGRMSVVTLPPGATAADGAFSPDGRLLALQVSSSPGGDGGGLAMQLDVATVGNGRLRVVPGTWVSSDALVNFGWPGRRDQLVAVLSFTTKVQVTVWRPGSDRLRVTQLRPERAAQALIVG
jgi:hypothetical protein